MNKIIPILIFIIVLVILAIFLTIPQISSAGEIENISLYIAYDGPWELMHTPTEPIKVITYKGYGDKSLDFDESYFDGISVMLTKTNESEEMIILILTITENDGTKRITSSTTETMVTIGFYIE